MPKELDLTKELAKLEKEPREKPHITYCRFPTWLYEKIIRDAINRDVSLTVQIRDAVTDYYRAAERGVVTTFDPATTANLDLVANSLGLERDALVRLIVAENFNTYLAKALTRAEERKQIESQIQQTKATSPPKQTRK